MNFFIKRLGVILLAVLQLGLKYIIESIRLIASSARTTPADDSLSNTVRGGVMNHRTGKFDEGNDPAGWYERD